MSGGLPPSPCTSTTRWFAPDSGGGTAPATVAADTADATCASDPPTSKAAAPVAPGCLASKAVAHSGRRPHIFRLISARLDFRLFLVLVLFRPSFTA